MFFLLVGALILAIRALLITLGFYKSPVLSAFEQYGEERPYSPLMNLFVWLWISIWLGLIILTNYNGFFIILACVTSLWMHSIPHLVGKFPRVFLLFPRWYVQLRENATREEIRRVAYMWLHLPRNLRLRYQTDQHAFQHWVDLVLVSTEV